MQEVFEFLKNHSPYYIATIDGDQARVRAFGTIDLFEDKLYIQTGKNKDCYKQMVANPKVELCAFADGEWVRVAGTLVPDERLEPQQHMLDTHPNLKNRYAAGDGNCIVLYLKDVTATFSGFTHPDRVVKF